MAKVLISIPDKLLKAIDRRAKAEYETRSGYFKDLVERDIKRSTKTKGNAEAVFRALEQARKYKWSFPDGVEYVRSIRGNWEKGAPQG